MAFAEKTWAVRQYIRGTISIGVVTLRSFTTYLSTRKVCACAKCVVITKILAHTLQQMALSLLVTKIAKATYAQELTPVVKQNGTLLLRITLIPVKFSQ